MLPTLLGNAANMVVVSGQWSETSWVAAWPAQWPLPIGAVKNAVAQKE